MLRVWICLATLSCNSQSGTVWNSEDLREDSRFGSVFYWGQLHRTVNWIAISLIACGTLSILIAYEFEWKGPKPGGLKNTSPGAIHSLFGALSVLLVASQPISVYFKCPLGDKRRKWFNGIHRSMGLGSWIAAAISMTIAAKNFRKRISDTEAAFNICLILFASIAILVGIGEVIKKTIDDSIVKLGIRGARVAAQNQLRLFQIIALFSLLSAGRAPI